MYILCSRNNEDFIGPFSCEDGAQLFRDEYAAYADWLCTELLDPYEAIRDTICVEEDEPVAPLGALVR